MADADRPNPLRPGTEVDFADLARRAHSTLRLSGIAPSYTLPSLAVIDLYLRAEWGDDPLDPARRESAGMESLRLALGAYLGETLVRRLGAAWAPSPDRADASCIAWPGGASLCPFACVTARMEGGATRPLLGAVMDLRPALAADGRLPTPNPAQDAAEWLEQAESAASLPAWRLAAELAGIALRIRPGDPFTLARLGDFLSHDPARHDEALARFAEALAIAPSHLSALAGRAAIFASRSPSPEAEAACDAVLSVAPDHLEGLLLRGRLLLDAGRAEEALACFERAADKHAADARVHAGRGHCLERLGRGSEAIDALRTAVERTPDAATLLRLADLLEADGALVDAHDACRQAGDLPGLDEAARSAVKRRVATLAETPPLLLVRARQAASEGQAADAVALLQRAVATAPGNVDAWRELALGLARLGRLDEALEASARALAVDPTDPMSVDFRAVLLGLADRFPDAIAVLDEGLRRHASHLPLLVRRANFAARLGQFEEAAGFLERATAIDPASIEVTVTLAEALARSGNHEAALVRARAVLDRPDAAPAARAAARRLIGAIERPDLPISPAEAAARHDRGTTLASEERHEEALAAFREATGLDPGNPVFWNSRGACAMGQQLADEALECFDRALELAPDVGPLIGSRARALWALGRIEEAAAAYGCWLQIEPGCEEAARAIEALGGLPPD